MNIDIAMAQNSDWVESLLPSDLERLQHELSDLIGNGELLFRQGGSFTSRRQLNLGASEVLVVANYRQRSAFQKILQSLGFK